MKLFIRNHSLYVFLIVLCIQFTVYLFLYNRAFAITPPNHVHTIHYLDAYYPDIIRQSKLGAWSIIDTHTTLPTPRVLSYFFFVFAGKIAAAFNIDPILMYEMTRVVGGIALLISTYWLITLLVPQPIQLLAVFFTMVFDTGPLWATLIQTPIWQWTAAMPDQMLIARHFGFPHHLWGEAFGLALICIVLTAIKKPSKLAPLLILILGFAGTSTSPPYFVIITVCLFAPWLLYAAMTRSLKRTFLPIILAIGAIAASGLFIKMQFAVGPPWNAFVAVEKQWWTTNEILIPFIQSFSLYYPFVAVLLPLAPLSWPKWSNSTRRAFVLTFCWSVLPIGLIYLSQQSWFPIANGRIASDLSPVPIGILSAIAVYTVYKREFFHRFIKTIILCLFVGLAGLSLFLSGIYIKQMMKDQDKAVYNEGYSFIYYQSTDLWNGIMALKNVPVYSHVLVNPRVGEILPAMLAVRAYQGNPHSFTDWFIRRGLSYVFYTGEMQKGDVRTLFKENNITYVFAGPEEKSALKTPTFYPDVLEIMYQNPEVTVYKVRISAR